MAANAAYNRGLRKHHHKTIVRAFPDLRELTGDNYWSQRKAINDLNGARPRVQTTLETYNTRSVELRNNTIRKDELARDVMDAHAEMYRAKKLVQQRYERIKFIRDLLVESIAYQESNRDKLWWWHRSACRKGRELVERANEALELGLTEMEKSDDNPDLSPELNSRIERLSVTVKRD